jgi:hypothetical protein
MLCPTHHKSNDTGVSHDVCHDFRVSWSPLNFTLTLALDGLLCPWQEVPCGSFPQVENGFYGSLSPDEESRG